MVRASIKVVHERIIDLDPHILAAVEPLFMIPTHITFEERMALIQAAIDQPNNFVGCEIGAYLGSSTTFLACGASFKNGHIHSIDTWENDAMTEKSTDTFSDFCKNTYNYRHIITPIRGHSSKCVDKVPDDLDLLFIDGDHSYSQTLEDMNNYIPKVKPGGMVLMHDTNREDVKKAISEFTARTLTEVNTVHTLKVFTA